MTPIQRYILNLLLVDLIALDMKLNTFMGGDPMETVSSRIGRIKLANGGRVPGRRWFLKAIDQFLELLDDNHSIEAIQDHPGRYGVVDTEDLPI